MTRSVLRGAAVLIALLGVVDPALVLDRPVRQAITVAVRPASDAVTATEGPGSATDEASSDPALAAAARLGAALGDDYEVHLRVLSTVERGPACPRDGPCVLVGADSWAGAIGAGQGRVVGAVRVEAPPRPLTIASVALPATTQAAAAGLMEVAIDRTDERSARAVVEVFDSGVPVGRVEHEWGAEATARVAVPWWPLGTGPRHLAIEARVDGDGGDEAADRVDAGITVVDAPYNVLVYDTRPSWTSTFVRRALEADSRLAVRVLSHLGPRVAVSAGAPFTLDAATLGEASVVVIGALDGLTSRDVDLLQRFVRVRGGSLILAPDRRPTGAAARLFPERSVERLEAGPVAAGAWKGSELLVFRAPSAATFVLARADSDAVVTVTPQGTGRVVVSGVMDGWRYRDVDEQQFDNAWRSLAADAAAAAGHALDVRATPAIARPGEDVEVTATVRAMAPVADEVAMSGTVACGDGTPRALRLWPTGDRRRLRGTFTTATEGPCRVEVSTARPVSARTRIDVVVADGVRRAPVQKGAGLEAIAAASGASVVAAGDEAVLARAIAGALAPRRAPAPVRPMRSPLWIVPFAGCLGLEWWLRRRHGLR